MALNLLPISTAHDVHHARMEDHLISFVKTYQDGTQQRDSKWFALMGVTVGGSEISSLMGINPYSSLYDVAASKLAILENRHVWNGGDACWWGTLFEDVLGKYVEIDLGGVIYGDNICVQQIMGHRNSPDGYIVARFSVPQDVARDDADDDSENDIENNADDDACVVVDSENDVACDSGVVCGISIPQLNLYTTADDDNGELIPIIVLLEFKCPLSRKPTGKVPRHYIPQLWSGLAVSPIASFGLFVDSVFRKCCLLDLGDNPEYDTNYHISRANEMKDQCERLPIAWGIIGVYAPKLNAPVAVRMGTSIENDVACFAWEARCSYMGYQCGSDSIIDMGEMDNRLFSKILNHIDKKAFPVTRCLPWFNDGRGNTSSIDATIADLHATAPEHHELLAILPWKLFEIHYISVARKLDFFEEIMPLITKVHDSVAESFGRPDSREHLIQLLRPPKHGKCEDISEDELQSVFDSHGHM
jgi:hypothetical protein